MHTSRTMPAVERGTAPDGDGAAGRLRVLLVDDHAESVEPLARLLEMSGHDVTTALSSEDALSQSQRQRFDLLLSDLDLPVTNGCDLLRRICQDYPIRGIAISAHTSGRFFKLAVAAGFERVLTKPLRFDEVAQAIAGLPSTAKCARNEG